MARADEADGREVEGRGLTRREALRRGGAFGLSGLSAAAIGTETGSAAPVEPAPAVEWTRTYDDDPKSVASVADVVRAPGGGYLLVGGDGPVVAASVDDDGCPRWVRTFEALPGEPMTVLPTDDGGFLVGLSALDGPHLARVGPSFDVEWTVSFFDEEAPDNEHTPYDVIPTTDGGYVVVGIRIYNDPERWAAKVDADGRVAWNRYYGFCSVFVGVVPAEDGEANYVVGEGHTGCTSAAPTLWGLRDDGTVAWKTAYDPEFVDFDLAGVVRTADRGYAFAGINYGNGKTVVWKVRPDRSLDWRRAYEDDGTVTALVATPDGGFAYLSAPLYEWENSEVSVTRLSAAGDVRWRGTYGANDRRWYARTLVRAPDGGFLLGGTVRDRSPAEPTSSGHLRKLEPARGDGS